MLSLDQLTMEHEDAVHLAASEKYLLNEISQAEREEFEKHFFDCAECADEVRTTAAFLAGAKLELGRSRAAQPTRPPAKMPWFEFLFGTAVTLPVFILLLLFMAYQHIVMRPRYAGASAERNSPAIPTSLSLSSGDSPSSVVPTVAIANGQPLLLSLAIPTAERFSSYLCVLIAPSGAVVWRLPVSTTQAKDTLPIYVPSDRLASGNYRLVVRGLASAGEDSVDLANYWFTLIGSP
jgi:hypothetical protein